MRKVLFLITLIILLARNIYSQNPIITHLYTADPSARVFDDTLWLYPSHDPDTATWFNMTDWHVFSTTDLNNWTDHGVALNLKDIKWAKNYAWAPDCGRKNGKYYFYFPTDQNYIGVAVGNSPNGPFYDPLGKPLITRTTPGVKNTRDLIDPCIFIDEDGRAYLFFGQLDVCVAELDDDMISLKGEVKIVKGTDRFFEAVWVHKYQGRYYISYSGKDDDQKDRIYYGVSDHVLGPYKFMGEIFGPVNSFTNHHSIVEYKGNWYFFYHNADLYFKNNPDADPNLDWNKGYHYYRRSVGVERLFYNSDNTIIKIEPTKKGIK